MTFVPRNPDLDWRASVRSRAAEAGVELTDAMVDELAQHLEEQYAAALAGGLGEADARARVAASLAESSFTGLSRHAARDPRRGQAVLAEAQARSSRRVGFPLLGALRMAVRQLGQHPRFALVTMLVLGLGTGAATTVFTIVDSVVLRPLPYRAPDRLVNLWDTNRERDVAHDPLSPVNFMDYRALPAFADAAAWWRPAVNLVDPGLEPVRVNTIETSANLFVVLGVTPQLGSAFGSPPANLHVFDELVAVISDRLWRTRYGADPNILGRRLSLSGPTYTVVGVMPPGFHYPDDVDVWQRLRWDLAQHSRHAHFMEAVARLSPGTTLEEAQAGCDTLALRLESEHADSNQGWGTRLVPILDESLGYYRPALVVLSGAVGLLLAMGILNVASLLLTRTLSRQREIGVRVAVGAAPRQLVAQLFAESLVLSTGGALAGLLVAAALLPLVVAFTPVDIPRLAEASLDWRALGVCVAVGVASTFVFGLGPALLLLRRQVAQELRSGDRGSSRAARRIYSVLVATEVALACSLLVCSALLIRTVREMTDTPTGVTASDVVTAPIQLTFRRESDDRASFLAAWRQIGETHARILEAVRRQPGVVAAGGGNFLPLQVGWRNPFGVEGQPAPARPEDATQAQMHSVTDGYFEALGARLARGRFFAASDGPQAPPVVVVNATFARRHLGDGGGLGKNLRIFSRNIGPLGANLLAPPESDHGGRLFEVVGVVEDVGDAALGQPVEPAIYFSARQFPFGELHYAVRALDPTTAVAALRAAVHEVAPSVPVGDAKTWGERFAAETAEPRLLMSTLVFFGFLASLLSAIGVYGIFSWSVALRTRELAIRLTLGALPRNVGRLVLAQTAALVAVGLFAGLVLVRMADTPLARVLYRVSPHDLASATVASLVLLGAALLACLAPVRRAMRLDPVVGLRAE